MCGAVAVIDVHRYLFSVKRGDIPYCKKCGYNLTGTKSRNCPECGVVLLVSSRIKGQPRLGKEWKLRIVVAIVVYIVIVSGIAYLTLAMRPRPPEETTV